MNTARRKTHDIEKIVEYWHENEDSLPSLRSHAIGWGEPFCFACGWLPPIMGGNVWKKSQKWLDKAHLEDWAYEHNDEVQNIVLLCHLCHTEMPSFSERDRAVEWIEAHPSAEWHWQLWTDAVFENRTNPPTRNTTMFRTRMRFLEATNTARVEIEKTGGYLTSDMIH